MPDRETQQTLQRGRAAFERRDYTSALSEFRAVLEEHPGFADVQHMMGLCLSYLDEPKAALEAYDRALALNDEYVEAHVHRAITMAELGRYDEAREAFERARECEQKKAGRFPAMASARLANAHAAVGDLYMEIGAAEDAAGQYRTAVELRPGFLDIRNKLGLALIEMGDLPAAETQLAFAVDGNPDYIEARLNLGLVHYKLDALERAEREWERCAEQEPDHPQVRAYLGMLERKRTAHDPSGGGGGDGDGDGDGEG